MKTRKQISIKRLYMLLTHYSEECMAEPVSNVEKHYKGINKNNKIIDRYLRYVLEHKDDVL